MQRKRSLRAGTLCLGLAIMGACGDGKTQKTKGERKDVNTASGTALGPNGMPSGFLTAGDVAKPNGLLKMTNEYLAEHLAKELQLFPPAKGQKPVAKSCIERVFASIKPTVVEGRWSLKDAKFNASSCFQESVPTNVVAQIFEFVSLESQDRTTEASRKFILETRYNIGRVVEGKEFPMFVIQARNNGAGKMCEEVGGIYSNCESLGISSAETAIGLRSNYQRLRFRDVKGKTGDPYYSSGTVEFEINNWTGVITFTGSNTPPTWTAQDGAEKASGTLTRPD